MATEAEMRLHRCCFTGYRLKKQNMILKCSDFLRNQRFFVIYIGLCFTGAEQGGGSFSGSVLLRLRIIDFRLAFQTVCPDEVKPTCDTLSLIPAAHSLNKLTRFEIK